MNKKEENFRIPKAHLCKVRWKLVQWFRRRFLNFVFVFSHFLYYSILPPLEKGQGPAFEQISFLSPKDVFVPSLFEIDPVVSSEKILAISLLFPLGKGRGSSYQLNESLLPKNDLSRVVLEKNCFKFRQCNISSLERAWFFIWTNLNSLLPKDASATFGWSSPSYSGDENKNVDIWNYRHTDKRLEKLSWVFRSSEGKNV